MRHALEDIGPLATTERLAKLATIANVAHRLSLNQTSVNDTPDQGADDPGRMRLIMSRIPVDKLLQDYSRGARGWSLGMRLENLLLSRINDAMEI